MLQVDRNYEGIYLCQRIYALDIISEVGLLRVKPMTFPLEQNHNLALAKGVVFVSSGEISTFDGLNYLSFGYLS